MNTPRTLPTDFAEAYRSYMAELGFREKTAAEWDGKAEGFNRRASKASPYLDAFLGRMTLRPEDTVLDVGGGPGTLALRMAAATAHVYCLDHSPKMLA